MTDQIILKRKGGRPPLPPAPQNAAETRAIIAAEIVKQNPRTRTLQQLYRLLKSFVLAEDAARADAKLKALAESNRLEQEELALKKSEYLRRMSLGPLGAKVMIQQIATLKARVASLEAELTGVNSGSVTVLDCGICGSVPTLTGKDGSVECPA